MLQNLTCAYVDGFNMVEPSLLVLFLSFCHRLLFVANPSKPSSDHFFREHGDCHRATCATHCPKVRRSDPSKARGCLESRSADFTETQPMWISVMFVIFAFAVSISAYIYEHMCICGYKCTCTLLHVGTTYTHLFLYIYMFLNSTELVLVDSPVVIHYYPQLSTINPSKPSWTIISRIILAITSHKPLWT